MYKYTCNYMFIHTLIYIYIYVCNLISWPKDWTSLSRYILHAGLLSALCLDLTLFVSIEHLNTSSKYIITTALEFIWTSLLLIILSFHGIQPDFGTVHFGATKMLWTKLRSEGFSWHLRQFCLTGNFSKTENRIFFL